MIDVDTEQLLTAKQACEIFPTPVSLPTIWRWMLKGARGTVLESVRVGGRRYTSAEACSRFIAASDKTAVTRNRRPRNRSEKVQQAQAILDQFGI